MNTPPNPAPQYQTTQLPEKPAGLFIRSIALCLDFLFFYLVWTIIYAPPASHWLTVVKIPHHSYWFALIVILSAVLFEGLLGTSPGKFLLRLSTVYQTPSFHRTWLRALLKYFLFPFSYIVGRFGKRPRCLHDRAAGSHVVKLPDRLRWIKAVMCFVLLFHFARLHKINAEMWRDMAENIGISPQIDLTPQTVPRPSFQPAPGDRRMFNRGFRYQLPAEFKGMPLINSPYSDGYGLEILDNSFSQGILILPGFHSHPYGMCDSDDAPFASESNPCCDSPRQFLHRVFFSKGRDRWFHWDIDEMAKSNLLIISKQKCTASAGDDYFIRRIPGKDYDIWWVLREIPLMEKYAPCRLWIESFYIAGDDHYDEIRIAWQNIPYDESLGQLLVGSLEYNYTPTQKEIENETLLGETGYIHHAFNALRMSGYKYEIAELLHRLLAQKGTPDQKRTFALNCPGPKRDIRYHRLRFLVHHWTFPQ